jgi:hypothetical protein
MKFATASSWRPSLTRKFDMECPLFAQSVRQVGLFVPYSFASRLTQFQTSHSFFRVRMVEPELES